MSNPDETIIDPAPLKVPGSIIPHRLSQLKHLLRVAELTTHSLQDVDEGSLASRSGINGKQYLLLRIIHRQFLTRERFISDLEEFGLDGFRDASEVLKSEQAADWRGYLELLREAKSVDDASRELTGGFRGVREVQEDVVLKGSNTMLRSVEIDEPAKAKKESRWSSLCRRGKDSKAAPSAVAEGYLTDSDNENERGSLSDIGSIYEDDGARLPDLPPKAALILLLKELGSLAGVKGIQSTFSKTTFTAQFDNTSYTAITAGGIRTKARQLLLGIFDAKARLRSKGKAKIAMQEGSELAAWWLNCPGELPVFRGQVFQAPIANITCFFLLPVVSHFVVVRWKIAYGILAMSSRSSRNTPSASLFRAPRTSTPQIRALAPTRLPIANHARFQLASFFGGLSAIRTWPRWTPKQSAATSSTSSPAQRDEVEQQELCVLGKNHAMEH
ncbi:uncharacterized protein DSM5745_09425 [Aspergillus mulundensis]|uniref:Uncharacterized protein n=1 Tax=Aspergillus mulundensis TaxID=1810919 RepID=A0A3D8QV14_9EURO|nr:hypothetical protein DSM5745_09425 [Aspergillus mulundensis]RDW65686.1 hypothetical protein DSM5745_09425 [Aspergillus mulundensis]